MPIKGEGFEIHIVRKSVQRRGTGKTARVRTVGEYRVYIDGKPQPNLSGSIAEQKGPSDNTDKGSANDRRIAPGRYPLWAQDGTKYKTISYLKTAEAKRLFGPKPRPGIELKETGYRKEILIHPAVNFLSSEGCIHPTGPLPDGAANIDHENESRPRVIALIEAMKKYCGKTFPIRDGFRIPDCWCVVDDDLK